MSDWIPALSTTALLGAVIWLSRTWITTYITHGVRAEYDGQLERLRAELHARDADIGALRSSALSGIVSKQTALSQRRIQAVDRLWACVVEYNSTQTLVLIISAFDLKMARGVANHPGGQSFFKGLSEMKPLQEIALGAENERPYVSSIAWALYRAYAMIMAAAYLKASLLSKGIVIDELFSEDRIADTLKQAVPDWAAYIDTNGQRAHYPVSQTINDRILEELKRILEGREEDEDSVRRASAILKASDAAQQELEKARQRGG